MHYLHLVIVTADSPEDACSVAEEIIPQNNTYDYFHICGAISRNTGEIFDCEKGRFSPKEIIDEPISLQYIKYDSNDTKSLTLRNLDEKVKSWKSAEALEEERIRELKETFKKLLAGDNVDSFKIYLLKDFVDHQYEVSKDNGNDTVWDMEFNSFKFNECGVTNLTDYGDSPENQYCVFVDFHS